MALFTWDTADGSAYQIGLSRGDDTAYSFVHLSDTLRDGRYTYTGSLPEGWYNAHLRRSCTYCFSGADTAVWSRWSEGRRFYYTPDPAAIDPPPIAAGALAVHPNPAAGEVTVRVPEACIGADLELLDVEGRVLSRHTLRAAETTLDLAPLPNGVYLLRACGATRRVVKQ